MSAVLSLCVSVFAASSCDNGTLAPAGDGLDLRACTENWRTVYSPEQEPLSFPPESLGWDGGRLYTAVWERLGINLISFPDTGGARTTLLEGRMSDDAIQLDGGEVLFLTLGDPVPLPDGSQGAPTMLASIPGTGGASQVVATLRHAGAAPTYVDAWAVDAEQVYWVEGGPGLTSALWTSRRAGGASQMLALLNADSDFTLFDGIQPAGDRVLVYRTGIGFDVPVYSIPKTGGEAQRLPTAWNQARLIGVTTDGTVLVQRQTKAGNGEPGSEQFQMGRLRPGAEAVEPFSFDQPQIMYALKAWDDGAGGFYLNAWEWGPNGSLHATVWSVDAEGHGRRLACDPLVESMISAAAVGPDGFYGILRLGNTVGYWSVVKVAR